METVIADAGPLVAYLRRDDKDHDWAADAFQRLTSPLRTCDAALGEAFFLLQRTHGGADSLLELLERRLVIPDFSLLAELRAVGQLLRRYQGVPMSLADACLVRIAELHHNASVLTLDSDFRICRKHRRQPIPLIYPD
jgi:predicted nucleic acid-binding protein